LYANDKPKNNFVLKTATKDLFSIKIEEY